MNKLILIVGVLVAFVYFGGSTVPKVLRDNKKMLGGVLVGVILSVLMGPTLEGMHDGTEHGNIGDTMAAGNTAADEQDVQTLLSAMRGDAAATATAAQSLRGAGMRGRRP